MPLMRFSPLKSSYFQSSTTPSIIFSVCFDTNSKFNCLKLIIVAFCIWCFFLLTLQPKAFIYTRVAELYGPLLDVFCCNDFSFWYGKWGGPTKKTTFCKNSVAVEIFLERPQDWSFYRTRVRSLAMLVSDSLTDWLTHSCLVSLIDVTLACEDLNSKLGEVVTFADVDTEDHVGNNL